MGSTNGAAEPRRRKPPPKVDPLWVALEEDRIEDAAEVLQAKTARLVAADPTPPPAHPLAYVVTTGLLELAGRSQSLQWVRRLLRLHVSCGWFMLDPVQHRVEALLRSVESREENGLEPYLAHWQQRIPTLSPPQLQQLARLQQLGARSTKPR